MNLIFNIQLIFIGFINSSEGYGNAVSFRGINDDDIAFIETKIRTTGTAIQRQLDESIDMDCEYDEQHLIDIFGEKYAKNPSEFQFRRGDIVLIKALVAEVNKLIDEKGFQTFQYKAKKKNRRGKRFRSHFNANVLSKKMKQKVENPIDTELNETPSQRLKKELFEKIEECLVEYSMHRIVEYDYLAENTVTVHMENGNIYGSVICIACQETKKKCQPKRVYYHEKNESKESSYWVISNFQSHLKSHGLESLKSRLTETNKKAKPEKINVEQNDDPDSTDLPIEAQELTDTENDESIIFISEEKNDYETVSSESPQIDTNEYTWLYDQFCHQINLMVTAVLVNGDELDQMICKVGPKNISVTVAKNDGDGNCLFSAFVHQIFRFPIGSAEHINEVKSLRSEVVKYILAPDKFDSFEFILRDRVYEIKTAKQITDMKEECKSFVRNVLSKDGVWGGTETIKAVSEIYEVNVSVFNENDSCFMSIFNEEMNKQTVALAYRLACNGAGLSKIRNHYDSVCDIKADDLSSSADIIIEQMK